ncbi:MAG: carboxymuconolactone decarboxylase family protein [Burkholderiales bacterium]
MEGSDGRHYWCPWQLTVGTALGEEVRIHVRLYCTDAIAISVPFPYALQFSMWALAPQVLSWKFQSGFERLQMAATLESVLARCEPCLKFYIHKARELGASEEEVGEYLAVASVMGGCVGEMWALKAYEAMKSGGTAESCCS